MRWSQTLLPTLKEIPAEAEAISHILMIRAGLIRKLTSGVYTYLPFGLKVLEKVEAIVREEMDRKGGQELLLPAIQPAELWEKSGRMKALGRDMIQFEDRHGKLNVLGPTHEEVITFLVKNEVSSYRQLPLILYQIQTKFRDEARPRFGVIRSREFIMKDAYSFDRDQAGLNESYSRMYEAYREIFRRCGLRAIPVEADTGVMGGDVSHEFMIPAVNGEDRIVLCEQCGYSVSMDKAECLSPAEPETTDVPEKPLQETATPNLRSVAEVAGFLKVSPSELIKTLIYVIEGKGAAVLVRGDHEVNETKLSRALGGAEVKMADAQTIEKLTGGPVGFSGPVGLKNLKIIADVSLKGGSDFVSGANKADTHLLNVNEGRDFKADLWADLRDITETDACPRCGKVLNITTAIEIGHVFKLGTKYSEALDARFLNEKGENLPVIMGCYGIGVTRIIAACVEQNHDNSGIVWPLSLSPFQVVVLPLGPNPELIQVSEEVYEGLKNVGLEVLLDDRDLRAGVKFKDADLIGIPLQVVIGEKGLARSEIEIKVRKSGAKSVLPRAGVCEGILQLLKEL